MQKAQKLLLNLIALLLAGTVLSVALQNMDLPEGQVAFLSGTLITMPLGALILAAGVMTGIAILLKAWERSLELGNQYKKASRDLERKDVSREEAESKVKVLENKVETLEKALSAALKSQQPK